MSIENYFLVSSLGETKGLKVKTKDLDTLLVDAMFSNAIKISCYTIQDYSCIFCH